MTFHEILAKSSRALKWPRARVRVFGQGIGKELQSKEAL